MTPKKTYRIGQIVPSSNTTMETEIPELLRARERIAPERFTFHSSRMRMKNVTKEELAAMDADSDRCALELSDARVDVLGYACLVAIMSMGNGYHRTSEERLHQRTVENGSKAPVVTSAGALIEGIKALGAKTVSFICPYLEPLADLVTQYMQAEGITVKERIALCVPNNLAVGLLDPDDLVNIYKRLDLTGVDALVLSACVQMPSLKSVAIVEKEAGIPVISSAICTTYSMLKSLSLDTRIPEAGALLSGEY
jgi:maleate isomerase